MSKNKFPKSVSFNTNNAVDKSILEYVKRRNFSGYVKKLILADMRANEVEITAKSNKSNTNATETKLERLKRQLSDKRINDNSGGDANS
jgi:hypothetical protein